MLHHQSKASSTRAPICKIIKVRAHSSSGPLKQREGQIISISIGIEIEIEMISNTNVE